MSVTFTHTSSVQDVHVRHYEMQWLAESGLSPELFKTK